MKKNETIKCGTRTKCSSMFVRNGFETVTPIYLTVTIQCALSSFEAIDPIFVETSTNVFDSFRMKFPPIGMFEFIKANDMVFRHSRIWHSEKINICIECLNWIFDLIIRQTAENSWIIDEYTHKCFVAQTKIRRSFTERERGERERRTWVDTTKTLDYPNGPYFVYSIRNNVIAHCIPTGIKLLTNVLVFLLKFALKLS